LIFLDLSGTRQQLERQLEVGLQDIKKVIFPHTQSAVPSTERWIKTIYGGTPSKTFLPPESRIVELPEVDILANYPFHKPGTLRGLYDYECGKIFLCRNRWCRETLIHETLHSVSFLGVRPDLRKKLLLFNEGLTEFLAGHLMYQRYTDCYKGWKENLFEVCSVTYLSWVKLWGSFCRFVPISELTKIYFWDGTKNWESRYADFLTTVRQAGYPRFQDVMQNPKPTLEIRFLQECRKAFGKRFDHIYYDPITNSLDFSQMLL